MTKKEYGYYESIHSENVLDSDLCTDCVRRVVGMLNGTTPVKKSVVLLEGTYKEDGTWYVVELYVMVKGVPYTVKYSITSPVVKGGAPIIATPVITSTEGDEKENTISVADSTEDGHETPENPREITVEFASAGYCVDEMTAKEMGCARTTYWTEYNIMSCFCMWCNLLHAIYYNDNDKVDNYAVRVLACYYSGYTPISCTDEMPSDLVKYRKAVSDIYMMDKRAYNDLKSYLEMAEKDVIYRDLQKKGAYSAYSPRVRKILCMAQAYGTNKTFEEIDIEFKENLNWQWKRSRLLRIISACSECGFAELTARIIHKYGDRLRDETPLMRFEL